MPGWELLMIESANKTTEFTKEETDCIKTVNEFFSNKMDDKSYLNQLTNPNANQNIPDDQKVPENVKDAYGKIKNDAIFSYAYSKDEYTGYKKDIIYYLKNNIGHGRNEVGEASFENTDPVMMETKLYEYNTSVNGVKNPIDVPKFMTNYKAQRIANLQFEEKIVKPTAEEQSKEKTHATGKIFELSVTDINDINSKADIAIADKSLDLNLTGQANGVLPENPDGIKAKYNELKTKVLDGCDPKIQAELNKIFPDFDEKNFPDNNARNMGYAMTRVLSFLSALTPDKKNALLSKTDEKGNVVLDVANIFKKDNKNVTATLGQVNFIFKAVESKDPDQTLSNINVVPTKTEKLTVIKNIIDKYIKQLDQTSIQIELDYPWLYKEGTGAGTYKNAIRKQMVPSMGIHQFINTNTSSYTAQQGEVAFKDSGEASAINDHDYLTNPADVKEYQKKMIISVSTEDVSKYPKYLEDKGNGNVVLKPASFKDLMEFFKETNTNKIKDENLSWPTKTMYEDAIKYADNMEVALSNMEYLNTYINNNPEIQKGLALSLVSKYNGEESSMTRMFLENLWAKFPGGKQVQIWNMIYEWGKIYAE